MDEKLDNLLSLVRELRDRDWTKNHEERLDSIEKSIEMIRGNFEDMSRRQKGMEDYLGIRFVSESKYTNI